MKIKWFFWSERTLILTWHTHTHMHTSTVNALTHSYAIIKQAEMKSSALFHPSALILSCRGCTLAPQGFLASECTTASQRSFLTTCQTFHTKKSTFLAVLLLFGRILTPCREDFTSNHSCCSKIQGYLTQCNNNLFFSCPFLKDKSFKG